MIVSNVVTLSKVYLSVKELINNQEYENLSFPILIFHLPFSFSVFFNFHILPCQ